MPIIDGCCCFVELKNGSRASSVFTLVTGIINIIINIWMLVKLHAMDRFLEDNEKEIWMPPGILVFIYIELVFNLANIGLAMLLWIGINYGYEGKNMMFGWVYGMSAFRGYHIFLMVYVLIWIGGHRISDVVFVVPESLVVAFYWVLNTIFLIAALLCVVSYWQEIFDGLYGKEKRRRRFHKLSNIRQAARFPGTMTPSMYGSRTTLAMSQAMSRQPSYAPSQHNTMGSVSSQPPPQSYGPAQHSSSHSGYGPSRGQSVSSQHQGGYGKPQHAGYDQPPSQSGHSGGSVSQHAGYDQPSWQSDRSGHQHGAPQPSAPQQGKFDLPPPQRTRPSQTSVSSAAPHKGQY